MNNCALAYAPNQDQFECLLLEPGKWSNVLAALSRRDYRFLIVPQSHASDVPPGWSAVYGDHTYRVFLNRHQ